jgi:prepilin-type N-terminal cleavage/methylation domain-containing protein
MARRDSRTPDPTGYTLVEVLLVAVLLCLALAVALPPLLGWVRLLQARAVAERFIADVHAARMLAVRQAERVEVRFSVAEPGPCLAGYAVVVVGPPERVVRSVALDGAPASCLASATVTPLRFSSRGSPRGVVGRTVEVRRGARSDSIVVSALGRVRRSYRRQKVSRKKMPLPAVPATHRRASRARKRGSASIRGSAHNFPPSVAIRPPDRAVGPGARSTGRAGFSLVEVLVSLLVLAFAGLAAQRAMTAASAGVGRAGLESRMAGLATEAVETALLRLSRGADPTAVCEPEARVGPLEVRCTVATTELDPAVPVGLARVVVEVRATEGWRDGAPAPGLVLTGQTRR